MRTVTVSMDVSDQTQAVRAFKAIRKLSPQSEMGPTLARIRANEQVLSIETDCDEWKARITGLLHLLDELKQYGIGYSLTMIELGAGSPPERVTRSVDCGDLQAALEWEQGIEVTAVPDRVLGLIEGLQQTPWFVNVGGDLDAAVLQGTIEEAQLAQPEFARALLEIQNTLSTVLWSNFRIHYNRCWNPFLGLLDPLLQDLVSQKLQSCSIPVSDHLRASLTATIRGVCLESFFAPQVPITNGAWAEWIAKGHIPYGWRGRYPKGTLVVV